MKNRLFIFLATLPTWSHGQDTVAVERNLVAPLTYASKNAWHLSALVPSLTYERRIGPLVTLVGEYAWGLVLANRVKVNTTSSGGPGPSYFPDFNIPDYRLTSKVSVGIRRYYDFERRVEQGRSIRYNSSGYVMLKVGYRFPPADWAGNVTFSPGLGPFLQGVWGLQRTYRKNFYINLAGGPVLWYPGISFGVDAAIGYTLPTSN